MYLLLLQRQGLSYVQISLLLSVWAASALLLELPSGMLADLWSRKVVIALSMLLKAGGFLVWAFRPDFTGFLLGFIAWGAQEALCSGAAEALLYDALKLEGRESSFEAVAGAGELASTAAIGSAMIAGGFLFERLPRLTLLLSSFFVLLAGVCALFVAESRGRDGDRRAAFGDSLRELGRSVRQAVAAPGLAACGLLGAAFMAGAGLALLAGTLSASAWAVPLYFAYYLLFASADVVYWGALQRRIPSSSRATLTSLVSFQTTGLSLGLGVRWDGPRTSGACRRCSV